MNNAQNQGPEIRVNRDVFSVVSLEEADDDTAYWLSKTAEERMAGIESIRQVLYGYTPTSIRFQRIFEVTELIPR